MQQGLIYIAAVGWFAAVVFLIAAIVMERRYNDKRDYARLSASVAAKYIMKCVKLEDEIDILSREKKQYKKLWLRSRDDG